MKLLKHILSILLLIILQISFTNSFASITLNEELCVGDKEFSKNLISEFLKSDFKENHIFEASFYDNVSCLSILYRVGYEELVEAWEKLSNLGADDVLRRNTEALECLANGRSDKILLELEELLGGHSKARHGSQFPMTKMEQRLLGIHPTMPQFRSALKFDSDAIHQVAVNNAFMEHKAEIEAHFASGGGYKEWDSQLSGRIGEGYHNTGTRNNPTSNYVTTNRIKIAFDVDPNSPSGYKIISAYPWYKP